ncbi:hypothetical protein SEA_BRICOLE_138 [Mycobacterium phage Bricole]|uniref:Uncharacterized protein n=1 Tax=Mycobacterium phage Bricole TaxID=1718601 RepID=A0A0M4RR00_9CAUD|nr:hypothetical protein SEA_BRICOLE_138 [Mycobacterium phage Bricole]
MPHVRVQQAMSKEELIEAVSEITALFDEMRSFRKQFERFTRQGACEMAAAMQPRGERLADMLSNARRTWLRHGEFDCHVQVPSGAVHTSTFCRTITLRTPIDPLPHLTGLTIDEVQARGYRVCSHCAKRTKVQHRQKVIRNCDKWIDYLKNPI